MSSQHFKYFNNFAFNILLLIVNTVYFLTEVRSFSYSSTEKAH